MQRHSGNNKRISTRKEGKRMRKKVFITPGIKQAALAVIGWACFVTGAISTDLAVKVPLLALARVLP